MKGDPLVSKNRIRVFLQQNGVRTSKEFYDALDKEIRDLLLKVAKRAQGNDRATAMPHDL